MGAVKGAYKVRPAGVSEQNREIQLSNQKQKEQEPEHKDTMHTVW